MGFCELYEPCQMNGTCKNVQNQDWLLPQDLPYNCYCHEPWKGLIIIIIIIVLVLVVIIIVNITSGVNCTDQVDHCQLNPCENGGTCLEFYDGRTCMCGQFYTGPSCEVGNN